MLDTIVMKVNSRDFRLSNLEAFSPPATDLYKRITGVNGRCKYIRNPTKTEKEHGYKPRITIHKTYFANGAYKIDMFIECSAPKLVFGNNFAELTNNDFSKVINALDAALTEMGVIIKTEALKNAEISAIHYSKNIILKSGIMCSTVLNSLKKLDLHRSLDLMQTDFKNGGEMVKYHSNNYEIALYDKIKDLQQAKSNGDKRAIETDYYCQYSLFDSAGTIQKHQEVFRLEVRLKRRKLKTTLDTLGIKTECTLKQLFSQSIAKTILLHYWKIITKGLYVFNLNTNDTEKALEHVQQLFPKTKPMKVMELLGIITTCQQIGIIEFRNRFRLTNNQWYRIKANLKRLEEIPYKHPILLALNDINDKLNEFKTLSTNDLKM